jgi:serine/threonine protein kinase
MDSRGEIFEAASKEFHSRYSREGPLGGNGLVVKARRVDWKAEDWRDLLFNCQEDGNGYIVCTTLAGEHAAQLLIPPGETPYGMWIADELIKSRKSQQEPKRLRLLDPDGNIFCTQKIGDDSVALKTVRNPEEEGACQSSLREVAVLKSLSHKNVVRLIDVFFSPREVVIVLELLETSLRRYIRQRSPKKYIMPSHLVKSFMRQLTVGIEYVHSRGIVHRKLHPSHLLIDKDNNLKISSFSLARRVGLGNCRNSQEPHELVACWYRAPEVMLGSKTYCRPADMWICGCVLGEMASGIPLFPGDSEIDTIYEIFRKLGTPTEAQWTGLSELPHFKESFPKWPNRPWSEIRNLSEQLGSNGLKLIDSLLRYDPMARITAKAALQLDYLTSS